MPEHNELKLELLKMVEELPEAEQDKVHSCIKEIREIIKENGQSGIYAIGIIAVENQE